MLIIEILNFISFQIKKKKFSKRSFGLCLGEKENQSFIVTLIEFLIFSRQPNEFQNQNLAYIYQIYYKFSNIYDVKKIKNLFRERENP